MSSMSTTQQPIARRRRRTALVAGLAASALVLAACGGNTGEDEDTGSSSSGEDTISVFGAFATPLEEPWDGAIHAALTAVAEDGQITYDYVDDLGTADEMERALRDIIASENPDVIVGDAFAAEDAVREVAKEFPDTAFAFGSGGEEQAPNFSVFDNWLQDPAYLAGMMAGGLTKTGTIGVVGAMPIPEVNRIVNAFTAGAQESKPDAKVTVSFINSFFDPATAKQAAEAAIAGGADVLFAERDGVIAAAKEADVPVIGMMVNQEEEAPEHVATSLVWNMLPTVQAVIEQAKSGPEAVDLGKYSFMKEGGSELAEINRGIIGGVPDDLVQKVDDKKAAIMDGSFETPVDESAPAGSIDVSKQ